MHVSTCSLSQAGVYTEDKNEALKCNTKKDGARLNERTAGTQYVMQFVIQSFS